MLCSVCVSAWMALLARPPSEAWSCRTGLCPASDFVHVRCGSLGNYRGDVRAHTRAHVSLCTVRLCVCLCINVCVKISMRDSAWWCEAGNSKEHIYTESKNNHSYRSATEHGLDRSRGIT